MGERKHSSTHS